MDLETMPRAWAGEVLSYAKPRPKERVLARVARRVVRLVNALTLEGLLLGTAIGGFVLVMAFNLVRAALHFERWKWMVQ